MLFHRSYPARFASWAFLSLLVLFAGLLQTKPSIGFAGLGAVLVLAALLILANHERIWQLYKKSRPSQSIWSKPNKLYYQLNVYIVWPLVLLLGLAAIATAYYLA
jgi:hypothetical protein